MPRIQYVERNFSAETRAMITRANGIIAEYATQGFDLTLRQLYYQHVARGYIANRDTEYKRLGSIINDARLAGLVDWSAITDRTRNLQRVGTWRDPAHIVRDVAQVYRTDLWKRQPRRVEVWIEKDALVGVIAGVCDELGVPYFSCRGYTSQSEMWAAGQRIGKHIEGGQGVLLLHLGDHDPSGIDMSRDIEERIEGFIFRDYLNRHSSEFEGTSSIRRSTILSAMEERCQGYNPFELERIALNFDQVEQYQPPPNPAKLSDSRSRSYVEQYGDDSWELDALSPAVLADLIRDNVEDEINHELWDEDAESELKQRTVLEAVHQRWAEVEDLLA